MRYLFRLPRQPLCLLLVAAIAQPAELTVKNIVLYKHGIGYFERSGSIAAGEEARLEFKNGDMNDVLKSLTVTDRSGVRVTGIRYDSNATLEQQLQEFPFQIEQEEKLSTFLDRFRGAHLEVKTKDGAQAGSIVGARALSVGKDESAVSQQEQLTLLLDSGELMNFDLTQLTSMRLTDPAMQQKLKDYLSIVSKAKARDKRSIYIDSASMGARELKVSYIAPVAIWKSSYRLTLADTKSSLEGWAIIDNTTDEDWNNVGLSVVSGRPISFISLLDEPRFGNRQVAELPEDQAAAPEIFGGSLSALPVNGRVGSGTGGGEGRGFALMKSPSAAAMPSLQTNVRTVNSTTTGVPAATLGELFEYNFATPVTIKHNQSAMLPFLQDRISARKFLIYTAQDGEHPVNAAEVTNTSGKTLDGGPITVYDSGAYAGEALVETFKAGDKRLIGYAVDYGTRVTSKFESASANVLEIHADDGVLEIIKAGRDTRTYEVRNVDAKAKTLIIQQESQREYTVLSPEPKERTASAYRFEIDVPANGTKVLKVEQEKIFSDTLAVSNATPDSLLEIVSGKGISDAGRAQLQAIAGIKRRLAATQAALDSGKASADELTQDQTRLRQNIDSLNRVSGQDDKVRQYSSRLNENEVKLAALRDRSDGLKQDLASLQATLAKSITELKF